MPDIIMGDTQPEYSVTFRCHNAELAGRFYLLMEPLDPDRQPFYLQMQGITIGKDEVSERCFRRSKVYMGYAGQYRLHVLYEGNLFADQLLELPMPEEKIITILPQGGIQIHG